MRSAEEICQALHIDHSQILNIYPYGSKIYGTATENSDDDYVIVYNRSFLPSGAFKDNAISSEDKKIQGTCYSRSGFIDAINNYQITALGCLFLPEEKVIQKKINFQMSKFDQKEFARNIISTASSSWHNAILSYRDGYIDFAKKNVFHALRILKFGIQIKENGTIKNYSNANKYKRKIEKREFKPKLWFQTFIDLSEILKQ